MRALKAMPSLQLVVKLWMLTFGYLGCEEEEKEEEEGEGDTKMHLF